MSNYIILNKRKNKKRILEIAKQLGLYNSFSNKRTTILENDDMQISIDKTIIRIFIYSCEDVAYYFNLFTKEWI